jgi:hypothetical protein
MSHRSERETEAMQIISNEKKKKKKERKKENDPQIKGNRFHHSFILATRLGRAPFDSPHSKMSPSAVTQQARSETREETKGKKHK